jgi:FkbM family methyltransferase
MEHLSFTGTITVREPSNGQQPLDELQSIGKSVTEVTSFSQIGQDLQVLKHLNYKRGGYFVELGAHDGVELSNTLLMELKYGWNGVCIEPNPDTFPKLLSNRGCKCCNGLVSNVNGLKVDFTVANSPMYSGVTGVTPAQANRTVQLETHTLTKILDACAAPNHIDFLSLDTEGTELDVLMGIDFSRYTFGYMCVEHNFVEPARTKVREFLKSKGYVLLRENRWDDDFVPKLEFIV